MSVREYFWRKPDDNDVIKLPIKKPSVQITFKEINLSAGLYLLIQKKSNKENLSWKKNCDADVVFFPSKCLSVSEKITVVRDRVLNEIGSSDTWNQLK